MSEIRKRLSELKAARARKEDWAALAERIREIDKSGAWRETYATRMDWLHALHEVTGYAAGTIRRFLEARQFVDELAAEKPNLNIVGAFCDPATKVSGIAAVSLIKRIRDVAPHRFEEILPSIVRGEMSVRQIREFYDREIEKRPSSVEQTKLAGRIAQDFTNRALDAVERNLSSLSGDASLRLFRKRFKFGFVMPDAVAVRAQRQALEFADGFEARQVGAMPAPWLKNRILADVAFAATFFRHYWLILPGGSRLSEEVIEALRLFGHRSVGVAEVTGEGELLIKSRPDGVPTPDNRELALEQIFAQGVPQAA